MYINNLVDEIHLTCIDFDPCSCKKVLLIEGYDNSLKDSWYYSQLDSLSFDKVRLEGLIEKMLRWKWFFAAEHRV